MALDDFGTGYSSIGYLRSFTFDKLKLDRSLIVGIADDERVQRLVKATVALAEALDLTVTAEGVETEEEATFLRAAGCAEFQGFFFAKPSSAQTISDLSRRHGVARGRGAVGVIPRQGATPSVFIQLRPSSVVRRGRYSQPTQPA